MLGPVVRPEELKHLRRARDLIDREYARPLDVPALAQAAFMSPAHFSRQFRAAYGETPYSYLMTRRIERAKALCVRAPTVTDVCMAVGCTSLGSFSARFTEVVGESPSAYRARNHRGLAAVPGCCAKRDRRAAEQEPRSLPVGAPGEAFSPMDFSSSPHCFLAVHDQDAALAFYRDVLGLEVAQRRRLRAACRWLTVGSSDPARPRDRPGCCRGATPGSTPVDIESCRSKVTRKGINAGAFIFPSPPSSGHPSNSFGHPASRFTRPNHQLNPAARDLHASPTVRTTTSSSSEAAKG